MKAAINAVYWEILWKNRIVFGALGLLLALGASMTWIGLQAEPGAEWVSSTRRLTVMAFLVSILIAYAPFTLMESSGGWRMNSMITRWFALPMGTAQMVFLPLLTGFGFIVGFIWVWMQVLNKLEPWLDGPYMVGVMAFGLVTLNMLAWSLPRKPSQFWAGAALLFPTMIILALGPQDRPNNEQFRHGLLIPFSYAAALMAGFSWFAASRNRCGAWRGEIPLDWLVVLLRGGRAKASGREFGSRRKAMFWAEGWPPLRLLALSWLALGAILFIYISLLFREARGGGGYAFSWKILPLMGNSILPVFGVLWMAVWGLFTAGEPSSLFRSRLSSFRATLPVTCGELAGQRIAVLFFGWCFVWLPLLALSFFPDPDMMASTTGEIQRAMARFMAVGAFTLVGALPILLLGRFEGFPNFLLGSVCAWGATWAVNSNLKVLPGEPAGRLWYVLGALLVVKGGVAAWALAKALRDGHTTWRFAAGLLAGWASVVACLVLVLPTLREGGAWAACTTVLFVPLARLALCPLAIAANRHRA